MSISYVCNLINDRKFFTNLQTKIEFLGKIQSALKDGRKQPAVSFFYLYIGSVFYLFTDKAYLRAIKNSDFVYLDGFLIGWVIKLLYSKNHEVFPPDYYFDDLMSFCSETKRHVFLLGSTPDSRGLKRALHNLSQRYPTLLLDGYHGYFKQTNLIIKKISKHKTDMLIVGLGLSKQETWVNENKILLKGVKVILPVGNFINILAGKDKIPPLWITRYRLRWLLRLIQNSLRLWPRYAFGLFFISIFITYSFLSKLLKNSAK